MSTESDGSGRSTSCEHPNGRWRWDGKQTVCSDCGVPMRDTEPGRVLSCRYCGHDTENADGVCGPCRTVEGCSLSSTEEWAEHDKAHAAWKAETDAIMDVSS